MTTYAEGLFLLSTLVIGLSIVNVEAVKHNILSVIGFKSNLSIREHIMVIVLIWAIMCFLVSLL